jgi:HAD superfamily hydrolase (TIGR01509 family)
MLKPAIKVVTFDLDDTLWDVAPTLFAAEEAVYRWLDEHAPAVTTRYSPDELRKLRWQLWKNRPDLSHQISQLRIESLQEVMQVVGYDAAIARQQSLAAFEVFIDHRHQVVLFDDVETTLQILHQNYSLGVLTNGNADVKRLRIGQYFDFAFAAEQLNASKPAPDHFNAAMQASGARAEQIVHIGDHHEHDIEAALAAGCHAIWFNPEGKAWPESSPAPLSVKTLGETPALIEQLAKP